MHACMQEGLSCFSSVPAGSLKLLSGWLVGGKGSTHSAAQRACVRNGIEDGRMKQPPSQQVGR